MTETPSRSQVLISTPVTVYAQAGDGDADNPIDAEFDGPMGVAVDGDGNVFVADTNNHTIRKAYVAPGH